MSTESRDRRVPEPLRIQAERRIAEEPLVDLKRLTPDEIQAVVFELEVHKIELQIQNDELLTRQHEAETSAKRYQRLYDSAPTGYLTLDSDGSIVEANLAMLAMLMIPRAQLIETKLSAFLAPHCQDRWHLARRDLMEGRPRMNFSLEFRSTERGVIDAQIIATSASWWDLGPSQIQLVVIDVTDLRGKERALQAAVKAATLAEERERRKLAADLHDDVGQLLALASLKLNALGDADALDRDARMVELEDLLGEIRRRASSLSFQLSPPLLHDVGLIAALEWLADDLKISHGLIAEIIVEQEVVVDEIVRVTFYRAIRELLLNVVKHAGTKKARIRMSSAGRMARIAVEDDGVGMPPTAKRYGFGLLALRERVEQLDGSLEISPAAQSGTAVVVYLPTLVSPLPKEFQHEDPNSARR